MYAAEFTQTLGIFTYNMSVLGGVIAGVLTALLHNRFYTIELPTAISFWRAALCAHHYGGVFAAGGRRAGVNLADHRPGIAWVGN